MPVILFWRGIFFHRGLTLATVQRLLSIPDMTIALSLLYNKDHSTRVRGKKNAPKKKNGKYCGQTNRPSFKKKIKSVNSTVKSGCFGRTRFLRTAIISYRNDS